MLLMDISVLLVPLANCHVSGSDVNGVIACFSLHLYVNLFPPFNVFRQCNIFVSFEFYGFQNQ
jgi:hypothetical protein